MICASCAHRRAFLQCLDSKSKSRHVGRILTGWRGVHNDGGAGDIHTGHSLSQRHGAGRGSRLEDWSGRRRLLGCGQADSTTRRLMYGLGIPCAGRARARPISLIRDPESNAIHPRLPENQRRSIHTNYQSAIPQDLKQHQANVERISASVRGFYDRKEGFRINHGSTNSTRKGALGKDPRNTVDTSALDRVLHVDVQRQTALVEPNVAMDGLVEATLEHGLVPCVVMEFPGITVGGGYSGTSGESSSFRYGFFNQTLNEVEMVLATGEIVRCSRDQNADLFHGAAGAVGTLGVTTLVEIQLRPAAKYVEAEYHPVLSMDQAIEALQQFTTPDSSLDYVDGIMYSPTSGAVITGRMTNTPQNNIPVQRFSSARDPWFYLHVRDRLAASQGQPVTDAIPLPEYLFRYDRGGFWVGESPFRYFGLVPFNAFTRWFLDDFLHTRMLYRALHASGQSERLLVQDVALPYDSAARFVEYSRDCLHVWPLWLCPLKQQWPQPTMHPHVKQHASDPAMAARRHNNNHHHDEPEPEPMLNIGVWGEAPRRPGNTTTTTTTTTGADTPDAHEAFVAANRGVEHTLRSLRGMKWLYAQTYYSAAEFWADFDVGWYRALREKYGATTLPDVYEKVGRAPEPSTEDARRRRRRRRLLDSWPWSGFYGLWSAIRSRDYLKARNAKWKDWVPRF